MMIQYWYERLHSPPEEDWDGRYGTIAWIRRLMAPKEVEGAIAPWPATVQRTLERLAEGDDDIAAKVVGEGSGSAPSLSREEDLLVGLLATQGFSQRMAVEYLNREREARGEEGTISRSSRLERRADGEVRARGAAAPRRDDEAQRARRARGPSLGRGRGREAVRVHG